MTHGLRHAIHSSDTPFQELSSLELGKEQSRKQVFLENVQGLNNPGMLSLHFSTHPLSGLSKFSSIPRLFLSGFCQVFFLHASKWSYGLSLQFIFMVNYINCYSNIKTTLYFWGKTPFDNETLTFLHIVILHLLKFCLEFLHLCSLGILVCSFPIMSSICFSVRIITAS